MSGVGWQIQRRNAGVRKYRIQVPTVLDGHFNVYLFWTRAGAERFIEKRTWAAVPKRTSNS